MRYAQIMKHSPTLLEYDNETSRFNKIKEDT